MSSTGSSDRSFVGPLKNLRGAYPTHLSSAHLVRETTSHESFTTDILNGRTHDADGLFQRGTDMTRHIRTAEAHQYESTRWATSRTAAAVVRGTQQGPEVPGKAEGVSKCASVRGRAYNAQPVDDDTSTGRAGGIASVVEPCTCDIRNRSVTQHAIYVRTMSLHSR